MFSAVSCAAVSGTLPLVEKLLLFSCSSTTREDKRRLGGGSRDATPSPVCWYLCLGMHFTAVVVPMLVLLPAEVF